MEYKQTTIQITFRHPANFAEVLPNDAAGIEVALEMGLTMPLLELFGGVGEVIIEEIQVAVSPTSIGNTDTITHFV